MRFVGRAHRFQGPHPFPVAQGEGDGGRHGRFHFLGERGRQFQDGERYPGGPQLDSFRDGGHAQPVHAAGFRQAAHSHSPMTVGIGLDGEQKLPGADGLPDDLDIGPDVAEMDASLGLVEHELGFPKARSVFVHAQIMPSRPYRIGKGSACPSTLR